MSIKPARAKNSVVRMGFSGHAAKAAPSKVNLDRSLLESKETRRLLGTPVIAPEGILKEERATAMFRSAGEFPYRQRIPMEEKIRIGKEVRVREEQRKRVLPYTLSNVTNTPSFFARRGS